MCVMSMVADHFRDGFSNPRPFTAPPASPFMGGVGIGQMPSPASIFGALEQHKSVTRAEFEALKSRVDEMVALLKRAQAYDEAYGEPECESDEKMALLRRVAAAVGVDLDKAIAKT